MKSHTRDRAAAAADAHTHEHRAVHSNDCDEIISIKIVQFLCSPFHFCLSACLNVCFVSFTNVAVMQLKSFQPDRSHSRARARNYL